jgi:ABC-2 type transport system ATP-binding protein
MKRRLDLATALVHEPQVLFLDEPTTGLDPLSRAAVWEEVRRLNEVRGMTIFLTTQYLEEADALADRVGIIAKGRIVAEGTPADLKRSVGSDVIIVKGQPGDAERIVKALETVEGLASVESAGDEVVISVSNGAKAISPVAVALSEAGISIEGLTLRTPTLDDVFLHVTGERMGKERDERERSSDAP